jgi:undecaprenyl-diphosphatase
MSYPDILLLAVVQGLAELLPVSSSAHVILVAKLRGIRDTSTPDFVFLVIMLHTGTMFAAIVYFWRRWLRLLQPSPDQAKRGARINWRFVAMVVVATAATGVLGLGLKWLIEKVVMEGMLNHEKGEVESLFKNLYLIGPALAAVGVFMILADFLGRPALSRPLTLATSLWIGLIQGLCLPFRGFSRSGATISVALFRGLDRRLAEEFSFVLAVVLTPAVIVHELRRLHEHSQSQSLHLYKMLTPALVGMVFSFLAGLVALKLLSAVLESGRWRYFGVYCLVVSGIVFFAAYQGL